MWRYLPRSLDILQNLVLLVELVVAAQLELLSPDGDQLLPGDPLDPQELFHRRSANPAFPKLGEQSRLRGLHASMDH
jgi:hypothetical protein